MTRQIRSRRADRALDHDRARPLYARLLRLRYLNPSGFLCFVYLEGAVALGILLALAELVSWWGVLLLPVTVAAMVKLNDVIAGAVGPGVTTGGVRLATAGGPGSHATASRRSAGSARPAADRRRETASRRSAGPSAGTIEPHIPRPGTPAVAGRSTAGPVSYEAPAAPGEPSIRWTGFSEAPGGSADPSLGPAGEPPHPAGAVYSGGVSDPEDPSAGMINTDPVPRGWDDHGEQLDSPHRWARQSASRRYE